MASLQDPAPIDYATLRWYDVFVLMLPKEAYSPAEMEAIAQFVNEGGRLVTISEWGTIKIDRSNLVDEVDIMGELLTQIFGKMNGFTVLLDAIILSSMGI